MVGEELVGEWMAAGRLADSRAALGGRARELASRLSGFESDSAGERARGGVGAVEGGRERPTHSGLAALTFAPSASASSTADELPRRAASHSWLDKPHS